MSVLTLEEAQSLVGRAGNITAADSEMLESLLVPMAQSLVEEFLNYNIEQATYTEFYPRGQDSYTEDGSEYLSVTSNSTRFVSGAGGQILLLDNLPVRSITSINEDYNGYFGQVAGSFAASTLLVAGTDYYLVLEEAGISRSGELVRRSGSWSGTPGSIKIVYSAGYTLAELDARTQAKIKAGIWDELMEVWSKYQQIKVGFSGSDISSEGQGGGVSVSYIQGRLMGEPICDRAAQRLQGLVSYDDLGN